MAEATIQAGIMAADSTVEVTQAVIMEVTMAVVPVEEITTATVMP